jgi:hypothetical protein
MEKKEEEVWPSVDMSRSLVGNLRDAGFKLDTNKPDWTLLE